MNILLLRISIFFTILSLASLPLFAVIMGQNNQQKENRIITKEVLKEAGSRQVKFEKEGAYGVIYFGELTWKPYKTISIGGADVY